MFNLLNNIADNYFANILGKEIIKNLCVYNIDKKYYIKNGYLHISIKHRKFKEEFYSQIYITSIEECFLLLRNDYFNNIIKGIKRIVERKIKEWLKN